MRLVTLAMLASAAACGHGRARSPVLDAGSDFDAGRDAGGLCDADRDGFSAIDCGGDDCEDSDPSVHPGAPDGPTWEREHVDYSAWGVALAVDGAGYAHVHYLHGLETGEELRYATNVSGAWLAEVQEHDAYTAPGSSIVADEAGVVHVAYRFRSGLAAGADAWSLRYARRDAAGWTVQVVEELGELGVGVSLGLHADGGIRVAYHGDECVDSCPPVLRYAENRTGNWAISTPGDEQSSAGAALAIDAAGNTMVSFADFGTRAPEVDIRAVEIEEGVASAYVASADPSVNFAGYETALALDRSAQVAHVVYGGGSLGHAWQADGTWSRERIDGLDDAMDVPEVSVAVDEASVVHVAFIVRSTADDGMFFDYQLRYARGHAGSWSIEDVDAWYAATPDVALALDSDGGVHVAYVGTDNELIYARRGEDDPIDHDCDGSELR